MGRMIVTASKMGSQLLILAMIGINPARIEADVNHSFSVCRFVVG
jgi:hypothetical protein